MGVSRRGGCSWNPWGLLLGQGEGWEVWGAGHATHKRFSSPRPRKAPGCTVLMTLLLRSLWRKVGRPRTSPALGAASPGAGGLTHQKCWDSVSFSL